MQQVFDSNCMDVGWEQVNMNMQHEMSLTLGG